MPVRPRKSFNTFMYLLSSPHSQYARNVRETVFDFAMNRYLAQIRLHSKHGDADELQQAIATAMTLQDCRTFVMELLGQELTESGFKKTPLERAKLCSDLAFQAMADERFPANVAMVFSIAGKGR